MLHSHKLGYITFTHFSCWSYRPWKMQAYLFNVMRCTRQCIHPPPMIWWMVSGGGGLGVLGTLPWAPFFPAPWGHSHWWWRKGGKDVSQPYQQDSTQRSNRLVPETAGGKGRVDGWATSKKRKKQEEKRLCLYLLGYIKWQLLYSSVHNWVEIILVRRDKCRFGPTAHCWWWNIAVLLLHHKSLSNHSGCHLGSILKKRLDLKRCPQCRSIHWCDY